MHIAIVLSWINFWFPGIWVNISVASFGLKTFTVEAYCHERNKWGNHILFWSFPSIFYPPPSPLFSRLFVIQVPFHSMSLWLKSTEKFRNCCYRAGHNVLKWWIKIINNNGQQILTARRPTKTDLILIIFRDLAIEVDSLPYSSGFVVPL